MKGHRPATKLLVGLLFISLSLSSYAAQFTGTTAGIFINPQAPCVGGIICDGLGTDTVTWGSPATTLGPSGVTFTPASFDVDAGIPFKLGTVTLLNRELSLDTYPDFFDLRITSFITNQNATSSRTLKMHQVTTTNIGDPRSDADWISFSPDLAAYAFFVLEDEAEGVELWSTFFLPAAARGSLSASDAALQPILGPIFFGAVLGPNGFIASNPEVPEVSTGVLTSTSLLLLLGLGLRRRSKRVAQLL